MLIFKTEFIDTFCLFLRDHPKTWFDFFSNLCGIDYEVEHQKFGVVYHLDSIIKNHQLVLNDIQDNDRKLDNLPVFKGVSLFGNQPNGMNEKLLIYLEFNLKTTLIQKEFYCMMIWKVIR